MTSIHRLLSNRSPRKVYQGGSSWLIYYSSVNWTVFSVWEVLYVKIVHEFLIVNIKYNKSQTLNSLYHLTKF